MLLHVARGTPSETQLDPLSEPVELAGGLAGQWTGTEPVRRSVCIDRVRDGGVAVSGCRKCGTRTEERQRGLVRKFEGSDDVERLHEMQARVLRVPVEERDFAERVREGPERFGCRCDGPEPDHGFRGGARIGLFALLCEERRGPAQCRNLVRERLGLAEHFPDQPPLAIVQLPVADRLIEEPARATRLAA